MVYNYNPQKWYTKLATLSLSNLSFKLIYTYLTRTDTCNHILQTTFNHNIYTFMAYLGNCHVLFPSDFMFYCHVKEHDSSWNQHKNILHTIWVTLFRCQNLPWPSLWQLVVEISILKITWAFSLIIVTPKT